MLSIRWVWAAVFAASMFGITPAVLAQAPATKPAAELVPPGTKLDIAVPQVTQSSIVYASPTGPFALLNGSVIDLRTGENAGQLEFQQMRAERQALSPDGKFYASAGSPMDKGLNIYSTETGKVVQAIEIPAAGFLHSYWLKFVSPTKLVWSGACDAGEVVLFFDATTGKEMHRIKLPAKFDTADVSQDGKTIVLLSGGKLHWIDTVKGALTSALPSLHKNIRNMRLSPDGKELAATVTNGAAKGLVVWKGRNVVLEVDVAQVTGGRAEDVEALQFLPDASGILIDYRYLIDRATKQMVWNVRPFNHAKPPVIIVNDEQIVSFANPGSGAYRLQMFDIPRAEIRKAIDAAAKPSPNAVLKPGDSVALDIQVKNVRFGTPEEMKDALAKELTTRLGRNKFTVAPKAKVTMQVTYDEAADPNPTNIIDGDLVKPKVVGQTSQTIIRCDLTFVAEGVEKPLFARSIDMQPAQGGSVSSTDPKAMRDARVGVLRAELSRLNLPAYLEPGAVSLPMVTVLPGARDR